MLTYDEFKELNEETVLQSLQKTEKVVDSISMSISKVLQVYPSVDVTGQKVLSAIKSLKTELEALIDVLPE